MKYSFNKSIDKFKYLIMGLALVILLLPLNSSFAVDVNASRTTGWVLLYETDSLGNLVQGDLSELADAINAGADVKVVLNYGGSRIGVQKCETAYTEGVWAVCQIGVISSGGPWIGEFHIPDNPYYLFQIVNSDGTFIQDRWYVSTQTRFVKTTNTYPAKWYVKSQ